MNQVDKKYLSQIDNDSNSDHNNSESGSGNNRLDQHETSNNLRGRSPDRQRDNRNDRHAYQDQLRSWQAQISQVDVAVAVGSNNKTTNEHESRNIDKSNAHTQDHKNAGSKIDSAIPKHGVAQDHMRYERMPTRPQR